MKRILYLLLLILSGCNSLQQHSNVMIFTREGTIELELYPKKAPATVTNFLEYVDQHMYDGALFYRTVKPDNQPDNPIKIEVIQGGLGFNNSDEELPPIQHESTKQTGILHVDGAISMARADTGTVTSEFFICIGDQPELDFGGKRNFDLQGFAAFGKVTKGMDVVRTIQNIPDINQLLVQPVVIDSIRRCKQKKN